MRGHHASRASFLTTKVRDAAAGSRPRPACRPSASRRALADRRLGREAALGQVGLGRADQGPGVDLAVRLVEDLGGAAEGEARRRRRRPRPRPRCASRSRRRLIRVSRCAWSSLAMWYSAFSLRSPSSRAALIRAAISVAAGGLPGCSISVPQLVDTLPGDRLAVVCAVAHPPNLRRQATAGSGVQPCRYRRRTAVLHPHPLDRAFDLPAEVAGCEECLALGMSWVHLRMCQTCGHIGCCDNSPGQARHRALRSETGHPIIRSAEPGEDWSWCYADEVMFRLARRRRGRALASPA